MGKLEDFEKLSILEKIKFTYGKNSWQTFSNDIFATETLTDGPHGVRLQDKSLDYDYINLSKSYKSLAYPSLSTLANSFDLELLESVGYNIGCEANKLNVSTVLAPGINIIRHPRCGRAFEYFSEDPIVSGTLGQAYIKGIESSGAKACVKHFCLNNQETKRMLQNSIVDDRTLNELYLKPFEIALKAKPSSVMVAYNAVNGKYMTENKELINKLRTDLGFEGLIMSDWGAVSDSVKALDAGLNLEMPGSDEERNKFVYDKYNEGLISKDRIDNNARYVAKFLNANKEKHEFKPEEATAICLRAAEESILLLKNDNNILPLNKTDKILVVGTFKDIRYGGSGSSEVNPSILKTPYDVFKDNKSKFDYIEGFDSKGNITNLDKALDEASNYSKILVFASLPKEYESEGFDRTTLDLPLNYVESINKISKVNRNIIVILNQGSVTSIPFINNIKGLVNMGLAGSFSGLALYNILYGIVNPTARLAQSYINERDTYLGKKYPITDLNNRYREGLYVGYPYYYLKDIKPLFEFGYGLSYANFKYSVFDLDKTIDIEIESDLDTLDTLFLFVEDSQKYIRLKDYKKVKVYKESKVNVSFNIKDEFFEFYDDNKFVLGRGKFSVLIGTSLSNIIYKKEVFIKGETSYIHPSIDLRLYGKTLKKDKMYSYKSTLEDLKDTPYYNELVEKLVNVDTNADTNLMIIEQKKHAITDNMLHFYTITKGLNFTIYDLDTIIKALNLKIK